MKRIFGMAVAVAILGGSLHAMKPEKKKEASTNNASTGEEKKKGGAYYWAEYTALLAQNIETQEDRVKALDKVMDKMPNDSKW